jgi:hypothetical protein
MKIKNHSKNKQVCIIFLRVQSLQRTLSVYPQKRHILFFLQRNKQINNSKII